LPQTVRQYNVYVPLNYNDGSEVEGWKLYEVERELAKKFGGLTGFPTSSPLRGLRLMD
jgi:hypothetical protein